MNKHAYYIGIIGALVALVIGYQWGSSVSVSSQMDSHMSEMMMDMGSGLSGKTGDAFDRAFIDQMIVHHQGAVDMATQALANAKHQEIKDLSRAIISAQNKEIADMKAWKNLWYNQ